MAEHDKRATNHAELLKNLKEVNLMIQKAAKLRVGEECVERTAQQGCVSLGQDRGEGITGQSYTVSSKVRAPNFGVWPRGQARIGQALTACCMTWQVQKYQVGSYNVARRP